jgi:RNA polymerase sigma factor FliA
MVAAARRSASNGDLWDLYFAEKARHGTDDKRTQHVRNQLAERYLHLVEAKAETMHSRLPDWIEVDDLISAAAIRLLSAIERFDPDRGIRFTSYLDRQLWGAIQDELRAGDFLPRGARKKLEAAGDARAKPFASIDPDSEQLQPVSSIDHPSARVESADEVRWWLKGLSRREREILKGVYFNHRTQQQLAARLKISPARVSQMHQAILRKLQRRAFGKYFARYWRDHWVGK